MLGDIVSIIHLTIRKLKEINDSIIGIILYVKTSVYCV